MGSLYAISNLQSDTYEKAAHSRIGLSDLEYVNRVNSGLYSKQLFISDEAGFGLAQWTTSNRKAGLYDYCGPEHIDDLGYQLEYLYKELNNSYSSSNNPHIQCRSFSRSEPLHSNIKLYI